VAFTGVLDLNRMASGGCRVRNRQPPIYYLLVARGINNRADCALKSVRLQGGGNFRGATLITGGGGSMFCRFKQNMVQLPQKRALPLVRTRVGRKLMSL